MSDLIKVCDLWERHRRGNTEGQPYLVGALAGVKVILFRRHNADVDGPHWSMFFGERKARQQQPPPARRTEQRPEPERGPRQAFGSPADQQRRTAELAEEFDRRGPDDVEDLF